MKEYQELDCGCKIYAWGYRELCPKHMVYQKASLSKDRDRALENMYRLIDKEKRAQRVLDDPNAPLSEKRKALRLLKEHDAL